MRTFIFGILLVLASPAFAGVFACSAPDFGASFEWNEDAGTANAEYYGSGPLTFHCGKVDRMNSNGFFVLWTCKSDTTKHVFDVLQASPVGGRRMVRIHGFDPSGREVIGMPCFEK